MAKSRKVAPPKPKHIDCAVHDKMGRDCECIKPVEYGDNVEIVMRCNNYLGLLKVGWKQQYFKTDEDFITRVEGIRREALGL